MARVDDVAAAVIQRLGRMTAMKLEKLVYYCQCWHLVRHNGPLFEDNIEAWQQGPVVPALYRQHKRQLHVSSWPSGEPANLRSEERASIDWVADNYGRFSAVQLSQLTHNELPWRDARGALPDDAPSTAPIRRDVMRNYYARQRADVETAVALATANAALEGVEFDEEWQDRLRDVASGRITADDLVAEEIARLNED